MNKIIFKNQYVMGCELTRAASFLGVLLGSFLALLASNKTQAAPLDYEIGNASVRTCKLVYSDGRPDEQLSSCEGAKEFACGAQSVDVKLVMTNEINQDVESETLSISPPSCDGGTGGSGNGGGGSGNGQELTCTSPTQVKIVGFSSLIDIKSTTWANGQITGTSSSVGTDDLTVIESSSGGLSAKVDSKTIQESDWVSYPDRRYVHEGSQTFPVTWRAQQFLARYVDPGFSGPIPSVTLNAWFGSATRTQTEGEPVATMNTLNALIVQGSCDGIRRLLDIQKTHEVGYRVENTIYSQEPTYTFPYVPGTGAFPKYIQKYRIVWQR